MSISSALQNAVSGLSANSRMLQTVSGNLANQLTPGYASRSTTVTTTPGGTGGVRILDVTRASDPELTALRRAAEADASEQATLFEAMRTFSSAIGEIGEDGSLAARFQVFNNALLALADTPESSPRMLAVIDAAQDVVAGIRSAADEARRVREGADTDIARDVRDINAALVRIADLNREIQVLDATGRDSTSLKDERERQVDLVASALPIRETIGDDGRIELKTEQGLILVDRTARQLDFVSTPVITHDMVYGGGSGALSGLMLDGIDIAPGSGHPQSVTGGRLAANFEVRDRASVAFSDQLDALSGEIISRSELGALDPTLSAGDPGLFTDAGTAFNAGTLSGLAGRIAVNDAVIPSQGGDPSRLRDGLNSGSPGPVGSDILLRSYLDSFSARRDASGVPGLSGNLDLGATLSSLSEARASLRVGSESDQVLAENARAILAIEEGKARAVNADQELQELIRLEQAYAANAQVIQVASRMLDRLTEL